MRGVVYADFDPRSIPTSPMMAAAEPPISSHIVLSVGEPVNIREKLELTESEALKP